MINAFFYGIVLAFGLIIPLGVQNVFIFNQGVTQKHLSHALPSVLTAFICDLILILVAVLGLSVIVLAMPLFKTIIISIGLIFLLYMAWLTWNNQGHAKGEHKPLSTKAQIAFAASLSLFNPHALLDTIGVIGTSSLSFSGQEKFAFSLACIIVSFCWFMFLSVSGHYINKMDGTGAFVTKLNKLSAIVMCLLAGYLAYQILWK